VTQKTHPEAARIAQYITGCNFIELYWEIKRSKSPKTAVAQGLASVTQYRLVQFVINLVNDWYQKREQLNTAHDQLDWRD
jgi:hypothetical protein